MDPRTQVRAATVVRLKKLVEQNSEGTSVLWLGYPGVDLLRDEDAYIVRTDGQHTLTAMSARTPRTDEFVIHIELQAAKHGQSDVEAYERTDEIFAFFENAVADNPKNLGSVDGLKKITIARVDGPFVVPADNEWRGYLNFDIGCLAQYL